MKALLPITLLATLVLGGAFLLSDLGGSVRSSQAAGPYAPGFAKVQRDKGPVFRQGCLVYGNRVNSGRCVYGNPRSQNIVVVFGDSHALQWTPALLKIAKRRDWRLVALLRGNCTPALVRIDRVCDRWRRNSLTRIRTLKPDLVVLGTNTGKAVVTRKGNRTLSRTASGQVLRAGMVTDDEKAAQLGIRRDPHEGPDRGALHAFGLRETEPWSPGQMRLQGAASFLALIRLQGRTQDERVKTIDALPRICPARPLCGGFGPGSGLAGPRSPQRHLRSDPHRLARPQAAETLISTKVLIVATVVVALILCVPTAQARFEPGLNKVGNDKGEVFRFGCLTGVKTVHSPKCYFGDVKSRKNLVIFGDSHAMRMGPGTDSARQAKGVGG